MKKSVVFQRYVLLLRLFLLQLLFFTAHRILFLTLFKPTWLHWSSYDLWSSFYLGIKFDLRLALITLIPFLLLGWIGPINVIRKGRSHLFWRIYFFLTMLSIQITYFIDYGHYQYLQSRIQAGILNFLEDWTISLGMVGQTYSLTSAIILLAILMFIYSRLLKWSFLIIDGSPYGLLISFWRKLTTWTFIILLGALGIYGKISFYPLRWSDAFFTPDSFISALGLNPVLYFFDTLQFQEATYDIKKVKEFYPIMANFLKIPAEDWDPENLNFRRSYTPQNPKAPNANVVIVVMESMVSFKTGLFGNELGATPVVDQLAKDAIFFKRFYTPVQATARSVFGLVTGIPDITQVKTSTRNPLIVDQHTIINDLSGYEKFYFLGGSLSWGNIRGLLQHNIDDAHIYEEGSYRSPRTDVWGISDYHLFQEANAVLKEQKKPFFAIIQTAGYHRPYTIPLDKGDFEVRRFSAEEVGQLPQKGFDSPEEFNSVYFQDYSLGHFLEIAKKESYFDNTIFIIFGDHGLPVKEAQNVSKGERIFDLENFHVPLLIYAPKFFSPQVDERYVSELDILPTVAGMVGKSYSNSTLGRDIFDSQFDDIRKVFVYYWYTNPAVYGVLDSEYFYSGGLSDRRDLYRYLGPNPEVGLKNKDVVPYLERKDLADAIYYTSQYLMYHNGKKQ